MSPDSEPLTVGAAARRLGISAPTLRSWERRYGLRPSARSSGGHRRYDGTDLARLQDLLDLVGHGVPTAEAAAVVRDRAYAVPSPTVTSTTSRPNASGATDADLLSLAAAMDGDRLAHEVGSSLDDAGTIEAWTTRLLPLLVEVGEQWRRTGTGIEVERVVSDAVAGGLRYHTWRAAERNQPDDSERPVVLTCLEREDHALPLLAVASALAERGVRVRTLGAGMPVDALANAVRRVRPAAVFVWSSLPSSADLPALRTLARTRPAYALVLGGPGWQLTGPPEGWVASLAEAVDTLVTAVRPRVPSGRG